MPRALSLVLLVLVVRGSAFCEDDATGIRTPKQLADAVVAAFESEAEGAMKKLAAEEPPDAWLVADDLCARGAFDAALAFAEALPRPDVSMLPTYIQGQRTVPTAKKSRERLTQAQVHLAAGRMDDVGETVEGLVDAPAVLSGRALDQRNVTSVLLLAVEARAGVSLGFARAISGLADASNLASDIGWRHGARELAAEAARAVKAMAATQADNMLFHSARQRAAIANLELGEYEAAAPLLRSQFNLMVKLDGWLFIAQTGMALGRCLLEMGHLDEAESVLKRAHAAALKQGHDVFVATAELVRGDLGLARGDMRDAATWYQKAAARYRKGGSLPKLASTLRRCCIAWLRLGDYRAFFRAMEECVQISRKLGDTEREAAYLADVGGIYERLGNGRKARGYLAQALDLLGERGRPTLVAPIYMKLASFHMSDGEIEEAIAADSRALELYQTADYEYGAAIATGNLGMLYAKVGRIKEAFEARTHALEVMTRLREWNTRTTILLGNGVIWADHGRMEEALAMLREGTAEAERLEIPTMSLEAAAGLAMTLVRAEKHEEALAVARRGLRWVPLVMGGLAAEESATVRERNAPLFEGGLAAALHLKRTDDALFFLESGRAGALLEALGGRALLREATIPPALSRRANEARAREARALERYRDAVKSMRRRKRRAAKKALEVARADVERAIEQIQLETRDAASLVYPQPASLAEIQGALAPDEALVLYAEALERALAIVVQPKTARLVDLGSALDVEDLCAALNVSTADAMYEAAQNALRKRVIEPLKLTEGVRAVLVSPGGALSYVPMAMLFPDRAVAYTPSASTLVAVGRENLPRGEGILALGDPSYASGTLPRLPGTRVEAGTVGTVALLGDQATETKLLAAIAKRKRWRALHLACHGLIDAEQPMRSALALTPEKDSDGMLTVLDVLGQSMPTDLAVLSACETGKGQVVKAEGIVGLTRAFMVAGAPRVICSLWKVDDAATRVLMERFYDLWQGKPGVKALPAAEALRQAQAFVRDHPDHTEWKHPYYWAAWSLWGLPK